LPPETGASGRVLVSQSEGTLSYSMR